MPTLFQGSVISILFRKYGFNPYLCRLICKVYFKSTEIFSGWISKNLNNALGFHSLPLLLFLRALLKSIDLVTFASHAIFKRHYISTLL